MARLERSFTPRAYLRARSGPPRSGREHGFRNRCNHCRVQTPLQPGVCVACAHARAGKFLRPLILRILCGIATVVVFFIGLILSFGAILAAPLGMWLVQRWTRRNDRRASPMASVVGGVLASTVLAGLLW